MNFDKILLSALELISAILILAYGGILPELLPVTIPMTLYYGWFSFIFLFFLFSGKVYKRISFIHIVFLFWCAINIILSEIPSILSPWTRFLIFTAMFMVMGGGIYCDEISEYRKNLLNILLLLFVTGTIISFILFLLGINLSTEFEEMTLGVFNQSMILGPVAAISSIFVLKKALQSQGVIRIIFFALMVICVLTCFAASSRSAIGGCLLALGVFIVLFNKKLAVLILFLLVSCMLLFVSNYDFSENRFFEGVVKKQEINEQFGGTFYSREFLWETLKTDFKNNPITGIGFFYISAIHSSSLSEEHVNVEPGSSWFFVLSSLGIVGLVLIIIVWGSTVIGLCKKKQKDIDDYFLISVLFFYVFHMFFEGYIFSSGAMLGVVVWLFLGVTKDRVLIEMYKKNNQDKQELDSLSRMKLL